MATTINGLRQRRVQNRVTKVSAFSSILEPNALQASAIKTMMTVQDITCMCAYLLGDDMRCTMHHIKRELM